MTTARAGAVDRVTGRLTPLTVHLASIVLAAVVIAYLGRRQWFYYDDWAFVVTKEPSLLTPHGGHLSILAILLFHALRAIVGVHTYLPYLACAVVTHLLLAHLLWRVMLRSRVDPWIATALSFLLLLFGTGAENIFWGFQVGYMGAMCVGVAAILLVTREHLGPAGCAGVAVLTGIGLATSGTSLPFVAVAIVLSLFFRGLVTTALVYVVPVVLYLAWYATKPFVASQIATPPNVRTVLTFVPRYAGRMFSSGFGDAIPVPGIGAVLVVALAVWAGARSSRLREREVAMPVALLIAAIAFSALTGYSRYGVGLVNATSSRYVYFVFAACLPALGAGATALAGRRIPPRVVVVLLVLATTGYNAGLLIDGARAQATIEQGTKRQMSAALAFTLRHPRAVNPVAAVDAKWNHNVTPPRLVEMHTNGWIDVGHYGQQDMLNALVDIATLIVPATGTDACHPPASHRVVISAGGTQTIELIRYGSLTLTVSGTGARRSRPRTVLTQPGRYRLVNNSGRPMNLVVAPSGTTYCSST